MHPRVSIRFYLSLSNTAVIITSFHYYTAKPLNEASVAANENVLIFVLGLVFLFVRLSAPQAFGNSRLDTRR